MILIGSVRFNTQYLTLWFQSISHIAQELGERVITNSAAKLKPYLKEAVQSTGILLDEYAPIVASIFQDDTRTIEGDYSNHSGEHLVCFFFLSLTA